MIQNVLTETLLERLNEGESVFVLDVRSEEKVRDFQIEHPNITNLSLEKNQFLNETQIEPSALSSLPRNTEIVVVCSTGNSAREVAERLSTEGYQTTVLEGGVNAWREQANIPQTEM